MPATVASCCRFSSRLAISCSPTRSHERLLRKWAVLLQLGQETTSWVLPSVRHERRNCRRKADVPRALCQNPSPAGRVPLPLGRAGPVGPDAGAAGLADPGAPGLPSPGFPGRQCVRPGCLDSPVCAACPGRLRWPCCPGWPSSRRACAGRADLYPFCPAGAAGAARAAVSGLRADGGPRQRTHRPPR